MTISVTAGKATDATSNNNTASNTLSRTYDNVAPTVAIISTTTDPTNVSPIPVTITFSDPVANFIVTDITVTNGTAGGFVGSGTTYTANITPTAQGAVTVSVAANVAIDAASNNNMASNTLSRTYDNLSPSVSITSTAPDPTNASPIPITITFSASVTGFIIDDITATNGIAGSFAGTGANYTATITPSGQGVVSVSVAANVAADGANGNTVSNTLSRVYDNVPTTVTISSTAPDPTNGSPIPVTITFSESVANFIVGDITVTNGTQGSFAGSGTTYTVSITPSANGPVTVTVAANLATDAALNNNTASNTLSRVYDNVAPSIGTFSPLNLAGNVARSSNLMLTFNEAVQKGTGSIIIKEAGSQTQTIPVADVAVSGNTVTINPADFTLGAVVNVEIAAGLFKDLSNNNHVGITTWNFTVATDATPPTVTDGTTTTINQGAALTITATISDSESTITSASVEFRSIATGGIAVIRPLTASGNTYTASITSAEIGELGIEYKLSATSAGGTFTSSAFKIVALSQTSGLLIPYSTFGNVESNYRIVSVPLDLTANTMNSVFDELGNYDKKKWRMYRYDNGATTELSGTTPMLPGRGYWLIAKANPGSAINSGAGSSVTTSTATPYEIDLKADWNQIASPYNFNLLWADVIAANPGLGLPAVVRVYNNDFENGTRLKKMEGAFVKVTAAGKLKFPVLKNVAAQSGRISEDFDHHKNPLDQPDWEVRFAIAQGNLLNSISGLGMNSKATDTFDKFDGFNMPRFFETFLELSHHKREGTDFYSSDIVSPRENHVWEFDIESNQSESTIALSWDNSYFGNNDRELYLWDVAQQRAINMRLVNSYAFDKNLSKSFRAIYGPSEFVKQETSVDRLVFHEAWPNPASDKVSVSFSLPQSAVGEAVSFSLVDMLGRKIWSKENNFNGGYHEVAFERSSETGPGLFILMVSNQSITKQARVVFR